MLLRRLVSLLVTFALLHLAASAGGAAAPCASHGDDRAAATTGPDASTGHAAHQAHASHQATGEEGGVATAADALGDGEREPCTMNGAAQCCDATVPCADHGVTAATRLLASALEPAARIGARLADAPPSFAPAPEPPPPKG